MDFERAETSVCATMALLLTSFQCIVRLFVFRRRGFKLILPVVLCGCETWSLDIK
jgi:hypothetical protein